MKQKKRVPVEKIGEYLEGTDTIAVEKDGRIVGFYIPRVRSQTAVGAEDLHRSKVRPESRAAIERLRNTLQKIYDETGLTEDEFADLMDPKLEFPYDRFGGNGKS